MSPNVGLICMSLIVEEWCPEHEINPHELDTFNVLAENGDFEKTSQRIETGTLALVARLPGQVNVESHGC